VGGGFAIPDNGMDDRSDDYSLFWIPSRAGEPPPDWA